MKMKKLLISLSVALCTVSTTGVTVFASDLSVKTQNQVTIMPIEQIVTKAGTLQVVITKDTRRFIVAPMDSYYGYRIELYLLAKDGKYKLDMSEYPGIFRALNVNSSSVTNINDLVKVIQKQRVIVRGALKANRVLKVKSIEPDYIISIR